MSKQIRFLHYRLLTASYIDQELLREYGEQTIAEAVKRLNYADMLEVEARVGGYNSGSPDVLYEIRVLEYGKKHLEELRQEFSDADGNVVQPSEQE